MVKEKTVKTIQGNLEIWEHTLGAYNAAIEQKYASRIFNKQTQRNDLKIHSSAKALELYIDGLNLIVPE
jgi:hypothetical protein